MPYPLYAVIGNPIHHSLSDRIHSAFAKDAGISLRYQKILAPVDQFALTLEHFRQQGGRGCNITAPFKLQASILCCNNPPPAVNTLVFTDKGITGFNTDAKGLMNDLIRLKISLAKKRVVILGAGGACVGILQELTQQPCLELMVLNRHIEKARAIQQYNHITPMPLDGHICNPVDVIINTINAPITDYPSLTITADALFYDLNYGNNRNHPAKAWAQSLGVKHCFDGCGMLVEQAALSFAIWHGVQPTAESITRVRALVRDCVEKQQDNDL